MLFPSHQELESAREIRQHLKRINEGGLKVVVGFEHIVGDDSDNVSRDIHGQVFYGEEFLFVAGTCAEA